MVEKEDKGYYYSFNTNSVLCGNCYTKLSKENVEKLKSGWYIKLTQATFYAIYYILASDSKKVYSFRIDKKAEKELEKIADRLYTEQLNF